MNDLESSTAPDRTRPSLLYRLTPFYVSERWSTPSERAHVATGKALLWAGGIVGAMAVAIIANSPVERKTPEQRFAEYCAQHPSEPITMFTESFEGPLRTVNVPESQLLCLDGKVLKLTLDTHFSEGLPAYRVPE